MNNHELTEQLTDMDIQEFARLVVDIISDMKGEDIVLMDLRDVTIITDFFIICTANSERQIKAIAEKIIETLKKDHAVHRPRTEGIPAGGWMLLDYGDIVIHIFSREQRGYYDLEELWKDGKILLRMQ